MSGPLKRLLRIRGLQEEQSRMELETEAGRLRAIEQGSLEASREARGSRERCFAEIREASPHGPRGDSVETAGRADGGESDGAKDDRGVTEGWREAESSWQAAVWRRGGFEARRPAQTGSVDRARMQFLAGRRERLQAETLVAESAARERAEQHRRDQRGLDDWFQSWAKRMREKEPG